MGPSFAATAAVILAFIAALASVAAYVMQRRMHRAQARLRDARTAAEQAARAAALAAPGGIDPEIVLAILNQGIPPTLDNVYELTQQRDAEAARIAAAR